MSDLTPKENTALDVAMTRLGELVDRMERASHPYPRERTWSDCDAEIERLRTELATWRRACDGYVEAMAARDKDVQELRLEMRSLLQVTVGTMTDVEIQREYGMLGWGVVKRCEDLTNA